MQKSTTALHTLLDALTCEARRLDLSDTQWAARAGVRKETLSRLRRRQTCDFETLHALAEVVGTRLGILDVRAPGLTSDGHFPAAVDRDFEERLADLCAAPDHDAERWASLAPPFFMAGLAVMLAGTAGQDRRGLLTLAERLHPGATEPAVFARWLELSPVRPSRFLPLVDARVRETRPAHAS